jgi:hypothetical protein
LAKEIKNCLDSTACKKIVLKQLEYSRFEVAHGEIKDSEQPAIPLNLTHEAAHENAQHTDNFLVTVDV